MQQGRVGIGLEVGLAPAARRGIGGDDHLGAAVIDAVGQRIGRETGENDGMDGPDPRAGQHRIGGLGDHRQIDHDPVAPHDALAQQHVRHPVHVFGQLPVGDVPGVVLRIVGLEDDRGLLAALVQMPVDAIHADIQNAVLVPLDVDLAEGEIGVLDLGIGLDPVQPLALAGPEGFRITNRFGIETVVIGGLDVRVFEPGRNSMLFNGFGAHDMPSLQPFPSLVRLPVPTGRRR